MKRRYREIALVVFAVVAIAAVFIQTHRYFIIDDAAYYPVAEKSANARSADFDGLIIKNLNIFAANPQLKELIADSPPKIVRNAKPFYMDRCEVRQGDYYRFQDWMKNYPDRVSRHPAEPAGHPYESASASHRILSDAKNPATGISFFNAYAYCASSGGRLPLTDEWERAANGAESLYPWGDQFVFSPWPSSDPLRNVALSCGEFPDTNTPSGISDLGAGVSEWTRSVDSSANERYFLSGGNGLQKPFEIFALTLMKQPAEPTIRSEYAGFRCVYDRENPELPWSDNPTAIQPVLVPSGEMPLGVPKESIVGFAVEQANEGNVEALRSMYVNYFDKKPFLLSKYEVTVWEFLFFLYDPLTHIGLYDHPRRPANHSYRPLEWVTQLAEPFAPVRGVDWWTAFAFTKRAGGRLPSEAEWIRAYTNNLQTGLPWGDEELKGAAADRFWNSYQPARQKETGLDVNTLGVTHLAGNVSEWTSSTVFKDGSYNFVVKGGNYILPSEKTSAPEFQIVANPYSKDLTFGIRVVFDAEITEKRSKLIPNQDEDRL